MTEAPNFNQHASQAKQLYAPASPADISAALQYISPDMDRDSWIRIGMAIQSELGDAGFDLFDTWSSNGQTYQAMDAKSAWRSFKPGGNGGTLTIATLFGKAKEGGYKPANNGTYKPHRAATSAPKPPPIETPEDFKKSCEIAQKFWANSAPGEPHGYADKKGFPEHGLRVSGHWLCVPAYNKDGQIQSVQRIPLEGKKKNLAGTKIRGCYYPIRGDKSTLVVCEGWATAKSVNAATGYACAVSFGCAALKPIAILMHEKLPDSRIIVAADCDHVPEAEDAAMAVGGFVMVPEIMEGNDFNDLHLNEGLDAVKAQFDKEPVKPKPDYQQSVETIAKFELAGERDKLIKALAKEQGIGVVAVRHDVNNARTVEENVADTDDLEPWSEPVDGDQLLQDVFSEMDSYVYFGREDLAKQKILTLSLYVMYTHCFDAFDYAPYLNIQSPTKRCGKNTVMNPMLEMSYRSQIMANATTAVLFRLIEAIRPTLFIDEADTFLKFDPELRGILNSGWHRNGTVQRCVGDEFEVKKFSTYCPKVIAGIGSLPDTIQDRSIVIQIRRKPLAVKVKRFRTSQVDHLTILGRKAARWAQDNIDELRTMVPNVPGGLNDRAADVWEPLMAIADCIGGDLPDVVRQAALAISAATPDSQDIGEMLVEDLFIIFKDQDFVLTSEILEKLHAIDSRPWNEYSRGKPITPHKLGNLLKRFGIESSRRQEDKTRLRGYSRKSLEPAWQDYLGEKA